MSVKKYICGITLLTSICMILWGIQGGIENLTVSSDGEYTDRKLVALTFDDGPHPVYTEKLLDGLKARNVKVTFFLIGKSAEQYPDLVKRMAEEGHLIGNHTMNHVQLNRQSHEKALEEIRQSNQIIRQLTGKTPGYIRPPFGEWSEALSEEVNMTEVLWDVDPYDWKTRNAATIVSRIRKNFQEGDIILLHDVYGTSVEAALEVVDLLKKEGYEFVTVDEIILD